MRFTNIRHSPPAARAVLDSRASRGRGRPVHDPLIAAAAGTAPPSRNWRAPIIRSAFRLQNPEVLRELEVIQSVERSPAKLQAVHENRLEELLYHAWSHTDYYRDVLEACGAVRSGKVNLDRFEDIPFLTKDIIRSQGPRLVAKTLPAGRKAHENSSGGSTGEPVRFRQDNVYWGVTIATRTHHFSTAGKNLGEREMKIWGNQSDFLRGTIGWKAKLENLVYNRRFEQCWHLSERRIQTIIRHINEWRPQMLWCYRDGIDGVARHINEHGIRVHSPASVVLGGATVYPFMAEAIEKAFNSPAISAYGSREVGAVACQCLERGGLHMATQSHRVEAIGPDERPVMEIDGELAITPLMNYAMPFIRYRIGDRGRLTQRHCACGRAFPMLDALTGRAIEVLRNSRGEQIDPIYFMVVLADRANNKVLRKAQIVQEEDGAMTVNLVLGVPVSQAQALVESLREAVLQVMGFDCPVRFTFVDDIPLSASGKFPYIVQRKTLDSTSPVL